MRPHWFAGVRRLARRQRVVISVAGAVVTVALLTHALAGRREEFAAALTGAPWWVLVATVALVASVETGLEWVYWPRAAAVAALAPAAMLTGSAATRAGMLAAVQHHRLSTAMLGALVWLAIVRVGVGRGRFLEPPSAALRACAMYWHFVVALWPLLYVTVYLL